MTTKILMCSAPSGNRGPASGYGRHISALKKSKEFDVDEISESIFLDKKRLSTYDVFWFYVRFDPQLFVHLQQQYPKKIFWVGPNVLFEKAEIGPSDQWENAFVSQANCTVYCNVADYYLNRVSQFFHGAKLMKVLPYCIDHEEYSAHALNPLERRTNDVLVYSKKRRIDRQFDRLFPKFIDKLEKSGLTYSIMEYGLHDREQYITALSNSKCCVWISIEDYCSNAQLEAQLMGCPIVGTKYNLTHTFDESRWVEGHEYSTDSWLKWREEMPDLYFSGIMKTLSEMTQIGNSPRDYVIANHSYRSYSSLVRDIVEESKSE